ncbi:hypothetical protein [Kordiimonas laminariae]|uniref:hypothetical protein n=1 Tax=Kordiimonas laminariae TaxID=2917717 RepID=UPI001FF3CC67|nr:hypothetical protein [Kordiimonas laminariae]MCK0068987.1 hypothetical protein [Kordiimonas laminariae]
MLKITKQRIIKTCADWCQQERRGPYQIDFSQASTICKCTVNDIRKLFTSCETLQRSIIAHANQSKHHPLVLAHGLIARDPQLHALSKSEVINVFQDAIGSCARSFGTSKANRQAVDATSSHF